MSTDCDLQSETAPSKMTARFHFDSNLPSFYKTMTCSMLNASHHNGFHLEIPISFVHEHGNKFQEVVSFETPANSSSSSGGGGGGGSRVWFVRLAVSKNPLKQLRIFCHGGWKDFVLANNILPGDELVFSLVAMSRFVVHVYPANTRAPGLRKQQQQPFTRSRELEQRRRLQASLNFEENNAVLTQPLKQMNHQKTKTRCKMQKQEEELGFKSRRRAESLPYTSVQSTSNVGAFPSIMKTLSGSHADQLYSKMSRVLEVPAGFARFGYCNELRSFVKLEDPIAPVTKVKCYIFKEPGKKLRRYQFTTGWKEFYDANNFQKGDTLHFTLTASSHFIVRVLVRGSTCKSTGISAAASTLGLTDCSISVND